MKIASWMIICTSFFILGLVRNIYKDISTSTLSFNICTWIMGLSYMLKMIILARRNTTEKLVFKNIWFYIRAIGSFLLLIGFIIGMTRVYEILTTGHSWPFLTDVERQNVLFFRPSSCYSEDDIEQMALDWLIIKNFIWLGNASYLLCFKRSPIIIWKTLLTIIAHITFVLFCFRMAIWYYGDFDKFLVTLVLFVVTTLLFRFSRIKDEEVNKTTSTEQNKIKIEDIDI